MPSTTLRILRSLQPLQRPTISPLRRPTTLSLRQYSTPQLAKPTKFSPPSHPPSLPRNARDPINYPGPPPKRDPATSQYPHTMPPPNTLTHYILTSRRLHFYISLSILFSLASIVSVTNFLATSPFAKEVFWDPMAPFASAGSLVTAYKRHVEADSANVAEMRRKKVADVEKRGEFRRAHGLEQTGNEGGFGGWGLRRKEEDGKAGVDPQSPTGGAGWVDDEIKKVEKEAGI